MILESPHHPDWIKWEVTKPAHLQNIFFKPDSKSKVYAGIVIDGLKVYTPENLNYPIIPLLWQLIALPEIDGWLSWEEHEPVTGTYSWIRDPSCPDDYELAWMVGVPGEINAVLPLDDTLSRIKEDQWQPLKFRSKQ